MGAEEGVTYSETGGMGSGAGGRETDFSFPLWGITAVRDYLDAMGEHNGVTNPTLLSMAMELRGKNSLQRLLEAIGKAGKYVDLDLSRCTMAGIEFDPDYTQEAGKDLVVSLILPYGATSIRGGAKDVYDYGEGSFKYFRHLLYVGGSNISTIGQGAFIHDYSLLTVEFPMVRDIGAGAFLGCTALTTVNLPSAAVIGECAFLGCEGLTTVNLPGVTDIGCYAFLNCEGLVTVNLPAVTSIGQRAFSYCRALSTVNLSSVGFLGSDAFSNTGSKRLTVTLPRAAPRLLTDIITSDPCAKAVTIKRPVDSRGYDDVWRTNFKKLFSPKSTIALQFKDW
jgi:hypothetical protein